MTSSEYDALLVAATKRYADSAAPAFELASRVSSRFAREHDARLDVLVVDPSCPTTEQQAFISTLTLEPLDDLL